MKRQSFKLLITIICVLAAGICYSCSRQAGRTEDGGQVLEFSGETLFPETQSDTGLEYNDAADSELETGAKPAASFTQDAVCYVHVCGEVMRPGVYEMKAGQRVFEAIAMAGGFTEKAAQSYLNLAEPVWDGMKLEVPDQEQAPATEWTASAGQAGSPVPGGRAAGAAPEKVNLNTATKEELMTLRGIGEAKAEDIIRYREKSGGFTRIEDIMQISGIKNAAFEKIKDDITV